MKNFYTLLLLSTLSSSIFGMALYQQKEMEEAKQLLNDVVYAIKNEENLNAPSLKYGEPLIATTTRKGASLATLQLLRHGANPNPSKEHQEQFSPLHWAIRHGNPTVIQRLIQSNADINERNNVWGDTPLMHSVEWMRVQKLKAHEHAELVKALLVAGADTTIQNRMNKTAADIAQDRYPEIAECIRLYDRTKECRIASLTTEIDRASQNNTPTYADYAHLAKLLLEKRALCAYHPYHRDQLPELTEQTESILRRQALVAPDQASQQEIIEQLNAITL